jgi:hypothetical protein
MISHHLHIDLAAVRRSELLAEAHAADRAREARRQRRHRAGSPQPRPQR